MSPNKLITRKTPEGEHDLVYLDHEIRWGEVEDISYEDAKVLWDKGCGIFSYDAGRFMKREEK